MSKLNGQEKIGFFQKFILSSRELSDIRKLAVCAMLLALRVVVGYFSNVLLGAFPDIKIGFNFLPIAIAAMLFGPVAGAVVGGLGDLLSFFLMPMGSYFPGWTINGILVGIIYGLFLYKNEKNLILKLIICEIITNFGVEVLLGSLWMLIQFEKAFLLMAGVRALKCLIAIPVETILIYFFTKVLKRIKI